MGSDLRCHRIPVHLCTVHGPAVSRAHAATRARRILRSMADTAPSRPTALAYSPPAAPPIALDQVVSLHDFEAAGSRAPPPGRLGVLPGWRLGRQSLRGQPRCLRPLVAPAAGPARRQRASPSPPRSSAARPRSPLGISPAALHGMAHPDGELATVRAGAAAGRRARSVSTVASNPIEAVAAAAPDAPKWFQLYYQRDPGFSRTPRRAGRRGGVRGPRTHRRRAGPRRTATTSSGCRSTRARMPTRTCPKRETLISRLGAGRGARPAWRPARPGTCSTRSAPGRRCRSCSRAS